MRARRSKALVPVNGCPSCSTPARVIEVLQPALLRHGGYGAARRTVLRRCDCGWTLVAEVAEQRPPR